MSIEKKFLPKITVAMPNKNNIRYLDAALNSVFEQDDNDFIFFISDNFSDDGSLEVLTKYKNKDLNIKYPDTHLSYSEHLEWMLQHVETEYVMFCAGDDILHPATIKTYNKILDGNLKNPLNAIHCQYERIDEDGLSLGKTRWPFHRFGVKWNQAETLIGGPVGNISAILWRVDALKEWKFNHDGANCIDWYFAILTAKNSYIAYCRAHLVKWRVNMSSAAGGNSNVYSHANTCKQMFELLYKWPDFDLREKKYMKLVINELDAVMRGKQRPRIYRLLKRILFRSLTCVFT